MVNKDEYSFYDGVIFLDSVDIVFTTRCTYCKARYCYRKSSVCPSASV